MTKLLLSVRSADEARIALAAGADVIDVKDPARGSLGRADSRTLAEIAGLLASSPDALLTAALGELVEFPEPPRAADDSSGPAFTLELPARVQYAKFGLARLRGSPDWRERWRAAIAALPAPASPVAAAYADDHAAHSPDALDVLSAGESLGCSILLVDTFVKDGRSLLDHWPLDRVRELVAEARRRGLRVALAGSLRLADAPRLLELEPDFLAVRGGACRGGRTGELDLALARRWAELTHASGSPRDARSGGGTRAASL